MRLPDWLLRRVGAWADDLMRRPPDFVIGTPASPYLIRWWVIPRNRWFNIYLHEIVRSDDDRALHDHPWINCSILLAGGYAEHTIDAGGIHHRRVRGAGSVTFRRPGAAHRLEVVPELGTTISLFITGPIVRHWGFHCPSAGWRHWKDFTGPSAKGQVGRGCGEMDAPPRRGGFRSPLAPLSVEKEPSTAAPSEPTGGRR